MVYVTEILGIFTVESSHLSLTICPHHREKYGLRWRSGKVRCSVPGEVAGHKSSTVKGDRGMNSKESSFCIETQPRFQGDESLQRSERTYTFINRSGAVLPFPQIEQAGGNQLPREHAYSHGADFHARRACSPAESEKK